MATQIERDLKVRMTAGFYARGVNARLTSPETTHQQREACIEEIRQMAQFCADQGVAEFVKTEELEDGQC